MPWCALVSGIQPPYLGTTAGMLHSGSCSLRAGLDSPGGCSLATGGCRVRGWCAGNHRHPSCAQAWAVDFLPGFSTCCPGCCLWRVQDVLGIVQGEHRESKQGSSSAPYVQQSGPAQPSPDPSSPCKGHDGKVRDEAPEPLQPSWLVAETAN